MKSVTKCVKLICLAIFFSFNISCQSEAGALRVKPEQPVNIKDQNGNFGSQIRVGDDANELINPAGWRLPPLTSFIKNSERTLQINEGGSQVKVDRTEYLPEADVVQTADGNTFKDAPRVSGIEDKSWRIRNLRVFSIKEKPFCYLMWGDWVHLDQNGRIKSRAGMSIVLVYFDGDGDGIFETFKYSSSESPPIPRWVKSTS